MENGVSGGRRAGIPERRRKGDRLMQTLLDSGRGLIIFLAGIFFLIAPHLGFDFFDGNHLYQYGFSGLCLLYGGWRVYRGYKKNY